MIILDKKNCAEKKTLQKKVYAHVTPLMLCSRMGKISAWQEKTGIAYGRTGTGYEWEGKRGTF